MLATRVIPIAAKAKTRRLARVRALLAWLLAGISLAAAAEVNVLPNGSFERRSFGGVPDRWTNAFSGVCAVVTNIATPCGDYVLRLQDDSTSEAAGLYSTPLMVKPGISYSAEAYILRTNAAITTPSLYIKFYNSAGGEIGSFSRGLSGTAGVWEYVSLAAEAPAAAASAKVLCYSTIPSRGTMYFDGVSFRETPSGSPAGSSVRFVAPVAAGSGTGLTRANPARYNLSAFWTGIKSSLLTNPVQVVFLKGEYIMNLTADRLVLSGFGNDNYPLTLEGERPFGTVFTRTDLAQTNDLGPMIHLQYVTNVVVRHLHWENDTSLSGRLLQYCLAINGSNTGAETRDVRVEGCSFVGLSWNIYGAMGFHHRQTHGGRVAHCEFIRGGFSGGFHMIYNAYGAYDLLFENNYFQDCTGSYLRLRAGCHEATVRTNEFVSTASAYNTAFIQMPTYNDIEPGDETWGRNFKFLGNTFTYAVSGSGNIAIQFYHSGFDPYRSPGLLWDYLLNPAEAAILTSGSVAARKELIRTNFGLNFDTQLEISGNLKPGYHAYDLRLETRSTSAYNYQDSNGVWHICPDYGGNGAWNISDLLTQSAGPSTNTWIPQTHAHWDNPANWLPATVPNGLGSTAILTNNVPGAVLTNTINSPVTLGHLRLGSLDGQSTLILEASRGSTLTLHNRGAGAWISAVTGNAADSINAPVELEDDLTITNTKTLTIRGNISELGPIGGYGSPRSITKTGGGTLVLYGTNTFSGGLNIEDGMVNAPGRAGTGPVRLGSVAGTNAASLIGSGTYPNAIFVAAGSTGTKTMRNAGTGANLTFTGPVFLDGDAAFNAGNNTGYTHVSGTITGPGALETSSAPGSANYVRLSGNNSFTGGVTLQSGILRVGHNSALGTGPLIINGGQLAAADAASRTLPNPVLANNNFTIGQPSLVPGTLDLSGPINLGAATRIITISNANATFSGPISGNPGVGFAKAGPGTLTLTASSSYPGPTAITNGGMLIVNGSLESSAILARTGTTLGGSGIIRGLVAIDGSATLSPGNRGIGALTISNSLTLHLGSATYLELNKAAGTNDSLRGMTAMSYGGALTVTNLAGQFVGGESYRLFQAGTYAANFAVTNLPALPPGLSWVWIPAAGVLTVKGGAALPARLTFTMQGGKMLLAWPASYLGWSAQSNAVSLADPASWRDIPGSQSATSIVIIPHPASAQVFYRLLQP